MVVAYIGLGSNLGDPPRQIRRAKSELAALEGSVLLAFSSLYIGKPLDGSEQPDYVNAVAQLETCQQPEQLLESLQAIEDAHHRRRIRHWGPRTLDLDLLLYDDVEQDIPRLRLPHPGIARRDFVLRPLYELSPYLVIPGQGPVERLLGALPDNGLRRL